MSAPRDGAVRRPECQDCGVELDLLGALILVCPVCGQQYDRPTHLEGDDTERGPR